MTSSRCHIIEVTESKISKHLNDYYNIRDQITTHRQKQQAKPTNTIEVISNVSYVNKNTGHGQARSNNLFMFCKIFCRFKRLNVPLMVTAKSFFVLFHFKRKKHKDSCWYSCSGKEFCTGNLDSLDSISCPRAPIIHTQDQTPSTTLPASTALLQPLLGTVVLPHFSQHKVKEFRVLGQPRNRTTSMHFTVS